MTSRGGGADHVRFQGTKKRPEEVQELNALVANAVSELLIHNKCVKAAAAHNSGSEDETENFNFKISTSGKNDNNPLESRKINRKCKEKAWSRSIKVLNKINNILNSTKRQKIVISRLYCMGK